MDFILLIAGLGGLWLGTELTIGSALAIARRHHLSDFFVGLVILAIGSDLPEIAVSIDAGIRGLMGNDASGVVVGSSIGSVIAQIGFVMGVGAFISILTLPRRFVLHHGAVLLAATLLLWLMAADGHVDMREGFALVAAYVIYIITLMNGGNRPETTPEPVAHGGKRSWGVLLVGLLCVIISSEITVAAVIDIAHQFQISEAIIAVLFIGLGTSLPELSISISAIMKKKTQLSVGNIIGSNILDTLLPVGLAAMISGVNFEASLLRFDLPFILILSAVVLGLFLRPGGVRRPQAFIILGLYGAYVGIKLLQF